MSRENEIVPEFLSVAADNSFISNISSPRAVMHYSHISSRVSLVNPDSKLIKTGIEYELGKYINQVVTEEDYIVKAVIPRYREFSDISSYTILAEYVKDDILYLDLIEVPTYNSTHSMYGYTLEPTSELLKLSYNSALPKNTILAKASSYGEKGDYKYGLNANVVFMSHVSVAEDGYVVSESFAKRASYTIIQKRVIYINSNTIPINAFGDEKRYKFIPDIGEYTKENGLLCALRPRNDWFSISDLMNSNLSEVDYVFDNLTYVHPKSKVIDIKVIKPLNKPEFSAKITEQLDFYADLYLQYINTVINRYKEIINEYKSAFGNNDFIQVTPRLHRFIVNSNIIINASKSNKIKLCYRKIPIEHYRLEIWTATKIPLQVGNKISDISAAKGVITKILPDEQMPMDKYGKIADIITDSTSTISRMNLSRSYEHYLGAVSLDNRLRLIQYFTNKYGNNFLDKLNDNDLEYFYNFIRGLYNLINPQMTEFIDSLNREELINHLHTIVKDNLYIYYPVDNEYNIIEVIKNIENSQYKPLYDKVTFKDEYGNIIETEEKIRVGNMYYMVLDKTSIGQNTAVSSSRTNAFGFPVKASSNDKTRLPLVANQAPIKNLSETEVRIITSLASPKLIAELMDVTLNNASHEAIIRKILESDVPFDTNLSIDRNIIPYGNVKSLALLRHLFNAYGVNFYYSPEINEEQNAD